MGHVFSKRRVVAKNATNQDNGSNNETQDPCLQKDDSKATSRTDMVMTPQVPKEVLQHSGGRSGREIWSVPRSQRTPWKDYLNKAYWDDIFKASLEENNSAETANLGPDLDFIDVMKGEVSAINRPVPKMLSIFVSSTFTDTETERNLLIEDVQPYLREVCNLFGYEFRFCEMRWGVRDEASEDHQTANLCMQELRRCQQESCGINFVTLLGDKYGYCPFPAEIPSREFESLLEHVDVQGSVETLRKWFKLDGNKAESVYVLQKISDILTDYNSEDRAKRKIARDMWWQDFELMQKALKTASNFLESGVRKQLYQISVTELEVFSGLLSVENANERTFMINRVIEDIEEHTSDKAASKYIDIDWSSKSVMDESRRKLLCLKKEKVVNKLQSDNIFPYHVRWASEGITQETHIDYLHEVTDTICRLVLDSFKHHIVQNKKAAAASVKSLLGTAQKILLDEVAASTVILKKLSDNVLGREEILDNIENYCLGKSGSDQPLVLYGESGSGKSSIIASALKNMGDRNKENCIVMFRFIGTTSQTGHTSNLLTSLLQQIQAVKGKVLEDEIPSGNMHHLANRLKEEICEFEVDLPNASMIIFLDAIDQLPDVDMISEIEWLPEKLSKSVKIVVSCTLSSDTGVSYFQYLRGILGEESLVQVEKMDDKSCCTLLESWLSLDQRKLANGQKEV